MSTSNQEQTVSWITAVGCMNVNKDKILAVLKTNLSKEEYETIDRSFSELNIAHRNYTLALASQVLQGAKYQNALNSKKVDPYAAGGLANGMAGVGAGLYAASRTAERNARIDSARTEGKINTRQAKSETNNAEKELIKIYNSIKDTVYSVPAAKQIHVNACAYSLRKEEEEKRRKAVEEKDNKRFAYIATTLSVLFIILICIIFDNFLAISFFGFLSVILSIILSFPIDKLYVKFFKKK